MSPVPPVESLCDLVREHGDGPALLLLLHAAGSGPRALDRLACELARSRWRTVAPAFERGGRSLIGNGGDPFAEAVALATTFLQRHAEGPRILFGHSMGGLIALKTAMTAAPIDALVLYEPIVLSLLDPRDAADRAAREWDAACIAEFRQKLSAGDVEAGLKRFVEAYGDLPWPSLPQAAKQALVLRAPSLLADAEAINRAHVSQQAIARIGLPVLLIQGDRSPGVLGRMADRLAALLPHAERVTLAGAGHMAPVGRPSPIARAVAAFLARRLGPASA